MADIIQDNTGKYIPKPLQSLSTLSKEEQDKFIQEQLSLGKLPRSWEFSQADRLYKNQQFRDRYGDNFYKTITTKGSQYYLDPSQRDEFFDREEYSKAVEQKFENDPNLDFYSGLTTEGLKDLWESDIKSEEELKKEEERLDSTRKSNEENQYKPKSRLLAAFINADSEEIPTKNTGLKDISEALAYERGLLSEEEAKKVERKLESKVKESTNKLEGVVSVGLDDEDVDEAIKNLYASNAKHIEDLVQRENTRISNLPGVVTATESKTKVFYNDVNEGKATLQEADDAFNKVFDNDFRTDGAGSRYYTGYKNKSELANFNIDDKVRLLSKFNVLSDAFGDPSKAMQVIDTEIFNIIKGNQNFLERRGNTLLGVAAKMDSMLIGELFGGVVDLAHSYLDNPEEYKRYKTAEDALNSEGLGFLFNQNYWNYVDQYAVWDPNEIQRINANGGIGGNVNLYSPTGKMTFEQFVDEGFKMLGYMLPAVVISAATKKVPRSSGWAKLIAGWELVGSAASLGSAYSSGVYNNISLEAEKALDEKFSAESKDFIKQYYKEHPDYIKDYLKAKGIKETDNELIVFPTILEAQKKLYEEAKEAYFNSGTEEEIQAKKESYQEALDRILYDAQLGARTDNTIETLRMLASGAFWGRWTKSQLTRDLLNKGYNPVKATSGTAAQASKTANRLKAAGMTVLSGGVDNGLDDITAGIGKAIGLGDYNNYIGSIYGPKNYVEGARFTADVLDGIIWGIDGIEQSFYDPQTWIDTAIGAAGSILGARINAITLIRDAINKEGGFSREGTEANKNWKEMSSWQRLNRYVTNGVTTSIADADASYIRTQEYVDNLNNAIFPKFRSDIQEIGNILNEDFDYNLLADSILEGKDIKQMGMLKSAIRILDALKDPVLAQLPEVQKFTDLLKRGKNGEFTYSELQDYINDPSNLTVKNAVDENGNSISEQLAREALQKNINNFLKISDIYSKFSKGVSKSPVFNILTPEGKSQVAVQLALKDIWQERLDSMQKTLKTEGSERTPWSYDAEFGSELGRNNVLKSLELLINKRKEQLRVAERDVAVAKEAAETAVDPKEREELYKKFSQAAFVAKYISDVIEENLQILEEKRNANVVFNEDGYARVLSEDEIMRLSPIQRAKMLDPANYSNYSAEQVRIIKELSDKLKNNINEEGKAQNLYQVALDAGIMQERLNSSSKSIREVAKNPHMLKTYMERVKERQQFLIIQEALESTKREDFSKLDSVKSPEEAIETIYRGKNSNKSLNAGFFIPASTVKEYIKEHPETEGNLKDALALVQTLEDAYTAVDSLFDNYAEAQQIKDIVARATRTANSSEEFMSLLEEALDEQKYPMIKLQFDRVLEKLREFGHQRDATKVRNRELEREKKQAEEAARLQEEEKKKDGKNYNWEGYKVGDTVYNKESGNPATVVGFEGTDTMLLEVAGVDGKVEVRRYHAEKSKDALTKEKPEGPNGAQPVIDVAPIGNPESPNVELVEVKDVTLEIDAEGKVNSPSAEKQGEAAGTPVIEVPKVDPTDQGNIIPEGNSDTISGNRWVEYSIEGLKEGAIRLEEPTDKLSPFGRVVEWLRNNKIKLQEIIDEEFGRIITDNPDTEIRFMMMKQTDTNNKAQTLLYNVIELTPEIKRKYHDDSRGGVITANGKEWLLVGITGFDKSDTQAKRNAFDRTMKGPISKRKVSYFNDNPSEVYYVDPIAYSKVQNTTSGRIINQKLGEEAPRLKKVSELLKDAKMTLRQAVFGIQTNQEGTKSFVVTKNVKEGVKIFPPRNVEDNRGRVFIMIETANGNLIPGMIEPAMLNTLKEESPLKQMIYDTLARLTSTSYETRSAAIKELCGFLVLNNSKNILIGKEDVNVITIKREGFPDITQRLGESFDRVKFLKDIEDSNFQINVTLSTLNDPVMLQVYDDSNALMTTVASMRTAGMSYTLYMTDTNGQPVIMTPVGNATPGTGTTEFRKKKTERVNNNTYDFKDGQWVNRANGNKVNPGTPLETSIIYNQAIDDGGWQPFYLAGNKQYYKVIGPDGNTFVVSRDTLRNIEFLSAEESAQMLDNMQREAEMQAREHNLEDVNLDDGPVAVPKPAETTLTPEQIAQQAVGNFEAPTTEVKPQTPSEVVKEVQEVPSSQPKEVITGVGKKSLAELQKPKNLSTFEEIFNNFKYSDLLYEVLEQKDWGITGNRETDAEILKAHNIAVTGITNVEDWINLIRDCK